MLGFDSSTIRKTRKASFAVSAASRQKGAYAVEFAFVFVIFFLILYGMITYGLIFAAQQSMNFAAESGARAGLQWQSGSIKSQLASQKAVLNGKKENGEPFDADKLASLEAKLSTLESFNSDELALLERAEKAWNIAREHSAWVNSMAKNTLQVTACSNGVGVKSDGSYGACTVNAGSLEVVIHYPYFCKEENGKKCVPLVPYLGPSSIMSVAVPDTLESRASVDLGIALDHSS